MTVETNYIFKNHKIVIVNPLKDIKIQLMLLIHTMTNI